MKTVSAAEANRHFSKLLRDVKDGETVTVTSRGEPVARIVPVPAADRQQAERQRALSELMEHLERQPARNLGRFNREDAYD